MRVINSIKLLKCIFCPEMYLVIVKEKTTHNYIYAKCNECGQEYKVWGVKT